MDDDDLLSDLDLSSYTESQRDTIAQNLYKMLEDRVGDQVSKIVTDQQFAEFEDIIGQADDAKLDEWLNRYVPTYEEISANIFDQLMAELSANPAAFLKTDPVADSPL